MAKVNKCIGIATDSYCGEDVSSRIRNCNLAIGSCTTTTGRKQADLINFPTLNVAMIPLQFMEYSLEDLRQVPLLSDEGAVLVSVPSPARYAMHKLIVAGLRDGAYRTKAAKDLRQSASLISFLAKYQPDELMEAWTDLNQRGKGWRARFEKGEGMLLNEFPI